MPPEAQPEVEDILQRRTHLQEAYSDSHAQWEITDSYVQGENVVWPKHEDRATRATRRSNQGRIIIDHLSDNILPFLPQWERDLLTKDQDAQGKVDDVEAFMDAVWTDASMAEMALPAKQWGRNFAKYGYAPFEVVFDASKMPDPPKEGSPTFETEQREFEERKWSFNPFGVRAPHPTHLLLPPDERRPSFGIKNVKWYKHKIRSVLEAKKKQRDEGDDSIVVLEQFDEDFDNPWDLTEVVEEYSRDWHSIVMPDGGKSGGLMLLEANLHRVVPFGHAFSGWGDTPGADDGMDPKYMAQGFLHAAKPLIQLLDQIISAKTELEMKSAFGLMVAPEELLERIAQIMQQGGNMVPGDVREVGFMPVQQLPQYLADFQDRVELAIVRATISPVSFGERPVGVDTVGVFAMMLRTSFKRVVEATEQLSFMASEVASLWMRMHANWGEQITVRGKSLTPSKYQKNYHIGARFSLTDEAVRMNRTQLGADLVAQGLKSEKRHLEEDQGVTNVTEERGLIFEDKVLKDPILVSAFAEKKRQELGVQELYDEQLKRLAAERKAGFAETQATSGLPGFRAPGSEEEMEVEGAEQSVLVRPPPASAGTGQRNGRGA